MRIAYINISNFRGIAQARIYFDGHSVMIGDNNAGKSTVFEAIDLVLGPDRMSRVPVVDEHDFFNGKYYDAQGTSPYIEIELLVIDLSVDQVDKFKFHLEFWNSTTKQLLGPGDIQATTQAGVIEALRVKFIGKYNPDEDDFEGDTSFCSPVQADGGFGRFSKMDKRLCGFLYLRALRTGSRALSMERGSLLDIILRIRELRPKMWENVLDQLRTADVASDPVLGVQGILQGVQAALKKFVPSDWGSEPVLRISDLTREHLRRTLTVFLSTGANTYHAPFQHQGTGTINTMVLALLSMIAEGRQHVIFAMEEPEIAIPPYTQKRITDSIQRLSAQALFTSHSPFVLEEFSPEDIVLIRRDANGVVTSQAVTFPATIRRKKYSQEFRMRFAEALLAKKVLICEGATEMAVYSAASRRLNELDPTQFSSLEALGVALFDAGSESAIPTFGQYFTNLGKVVFVVCDRQSASNSQLIQAAADHVYESTFQGIEDLLLTETSPIFLQAFYDDLISTNQWPTHLDPYRVPPTPVPGDYINALSHYLRWSKGVDGASWLVGTADQVSDISATIRSTLHQIQTIIEPPTPIP